MKSKTVEIYNGMPNRNEKAERQCRLLHCRAKTQAMAKLEGREDEHARSE